MLLGIYTGVLAELIEVLEALLYEENTDVHVVEGFLERLLPFCGRYPEPRSRHFHGQCVVPLLLTEDQRDAP
jgi:hypothetical protein